MPGRRTAIQGAAGWRLMAAGRALHRVGVPDADYHQNRYAAALADLARPQCRWLDLGAGTRIHGGWGGVAQAQLAQRARLLVGSELHSEHLQGNPYLTARCLADGAGLPFADAVFDLVSANMVVEHLADPPAVVSEVARVLAPGGRFVFVTPNRHHPAVWFSAVVLSRASRRQLAHRVERRALEHVFPTYYRCNTSAAIARAAHASGLVIDDVQLFSSFALFRKGPAPARWAEALFLGAARARALRRFRSNILAVLRKPQAT